MRRRRREELLLRVTEGMRRRKVSTVCRHCEVNVFSRCDPETCAGYAI